MATVATTAPARKPRAVKPAHGTARWVLPLGAEFGLLAINGQTYAVCRLAAGGYRLMKADGTTYDLDTSDPAAWSCSCPDFIYSRERIGQTCKHCKAVSAAVAHLAKPVRVRSTADAARNEPDAYEAAAEENW